MVSSIPGLYPPAASSSPPALVVTAKNVLGHCPGSTPTPTGGHQGREGDFFFFSFAEKAQSGVRAEGGVETESQADSKLSTDQDAWLDLMTLTAIPELAILNHHGIQSKTEACACGIHNWPFPDPVSRRDAPHTFGELLGEK